LLLLDLDSQTGRVSRQLETYLTIPGDSPLRLQNEISESPSLLIASATVSLQKKVSAFSFSFVVSEAVC
jgi:hypothetical protein